MTDDVERVEGIRLVTEPAAERLNERQLVDEPNRGQRQTSKVENFLAE